MPVSAMAAVTAWWTSTSSCRGTWGPTGEPDPGDGHLVLRVAPYFSPSSRGRWRQQPRVVAIDASRGSLSQKPGRALGGKSPLPGWGSDLPWHRPRLFAILV